MYKIQKKQLFSSRLDRFIIGSIIRSSLNNNNNKEYYFLKRRLKCSKADNDSDDESKKKDLGRITKYSSVGVEDDYNINSNKWKPEIAWLAKALEPALQLYKWALPAAAGNGIGNEPPPRDRSLAEIYASIQRSKLGLKDWSLSDLTIGLYLVYLRQASTTALETVNGQLVSSQSIVQYLIYHTELAKGAYRDNATALARSTMLRENNVVKFIRHSSVLRPAYYIGIDMRRKLVILGIRGTHTVYDLITDIVSSSHEEITYEGYSTHFGTAEAARWFLAHEIDSIRNCLEKHKGFRLRLVGHSLGGATASLLAIMLRKKSVKELGFNPDIITAVGYATPPCVSKGLAESCSEFVTTVVMQDDIIPRLSIASLRRLRNEIVETDWECVFKGEDWRGFVDLVTNAKLVVSSVQDVGRKLAEYAKFRGQTKYSDMPITEDISALPSLVRTPIPSSSSTDHVKQEKSAVEAYDELFVPGTLYYLKRNVDADSHYKPGEYFTLLRRQPGEHFQNIPLSSNIISDHKCDSHYYALRDVLKGMPCSLDNEVF